MVGVGGWVLLAGAAVSLLTETAQLTGIFGLYPCSYRLFDVDDLLLNTGGAGLGFALGGCCSPMCERLPRVSS